MLGLRSARLTKSAILNVLGRLISDEGSPLEDEHAYLVVRHTPRTVAACATEIATCS